MQSHQTYCSNTRSVNLVRARRPRNTWKDNIELDIDVDMEGFQNTSSVVFSNSQSNVFPSFPNNLNSISNKLSSISLNGKRKRQDMDVVGVLAMPVIISPFYLVIYARVLCSSLGGYMHG